MLSTTAVMEADLSASPSCLAGVGQWALVPVRGYFGPLMGVTPRGYIRFLTTCGGSAQQTTVLVALALLGNTSIARNK